MRVSYASGRQAILPPGTCWFRRYAGFPRAELGACPWPSPYPGSPRTDAPAAQAVFPRPTRPKGDSRSKRNGRRNRRLDSLDRSRLPRRGWRLRRQVRQRGARAGGAGRRPRATRRSFPCSAAGWPALPATKHRGKVWKPFQGFQIDERLTLLPHNRVRLTLKRSWSDGTYAL